MCGECSNLALRAVYFAFGRRHALVKEGAFVVLMEHRLPRVVTRDLFDNTQEVSKVV